jgi:hypothetical protein
MNINPIDDILSKLDHVHANGENQWSAACPCRGDDRDPSLSISEGAAGRVLLKCHRGGDPCTVPMICEAMGITLKDLYPAETRKNVESKLTDIYDYYDQWGTLVMQVLRFRNEDGTKTFRQRIPDPDKPKEWVYSTKGIQKPLYRLPNIIEAVQNNKIIYVAEGEKDVNALVKEGYEATCNPGGADDGKGGKWQTQHTTPIHNVRVVVIADRDEPGLIHARYVAKQLARNGCTVKIKHAPAPHKDAAAALGAGKTIQDFEEIETLEPDQFYNISEQIRQLAESGGKLDVKLAKAQMIIVGSVLEEKPRIGRLAKYDEFIKEVEVDSYDWVIDGLLERGERVMVVAPEGGGKSVLARQVVILAGAGIHPFTFQEIAPVRTLMVDLENPEKIIRRQSRRFFEAIRVHYPGKRPHLSSLYTKPDGLNILSAQDRTLLESIIVETEPEILALGPIYKSYIDPGGKTPTALITELAMYLDYIRTIYGCTLWLEHHAPLGVTGNNRELRPADSAVWLRWPEFGFAIAPDITTSEYEYDFKQWRGPRDKRNWPARLKRGTMFPFEVITYSP